MKTFLIIISLTYIVGIIANLSWLSTGNFPTRNPVYAAIDVIILAGLLMWAVILLVGLL